ncbi:hypothetical protein ADK86_36790 [Streptomyces sp. NRRL F-5755]|nr:hypothetical protein ADK86_36790 [Streptomyces sp. NRRL F-5755]
MDVLGQAVGCVTGTGGVHRAQDAGHLFQTPHYTARLDFLEMIQALDGLCGALIDLSGLGQAAAEREPVQRAVAAVDAVLVRECGAEEADRGVVMAGLRVQQPLGIVEFGLPVEGRPLRCRAAPQYARGVSA